jgi:hypothetical protein
MSNKNNPDYEIEQFWLSIKCNIINFYTKYSGYTYEIETLHTFSNQLNTLQKEEKYIEIANAIESYILRFTFQVIQSKDKYMFHILESNIKRWGKLLLNKSIFQTNHNSDPSCYMDILTMYIGIYKSLFKHIDSDPLFYDIFENIETIHTTQKYGIYIEIAIQYGIPSILEKLQDTLDISHYIATKYNIDISIVKEMKSKKLLKLLSLHKNT